EYLPFFRKIMMLYYENVLVRMLCKVYLPLYFLVHATAMVHSIVHKLKTNHIYNAVMLAISAHEVITVVLVEIVRNDITQMDELKSKIFWSPIGASKRLLQNFRYLTKTFKLLLFVGFLSIIILCISAVLLEIHPDWPIIDKNNPLQYSIFLVAFMVQCVGACIIVYAYSCMFFYACLHMYMQMVLLTEYLRNISKGLRGMDENRRNQLVKDRMLCAIRQHCKLSRFAKRVMETYGPKTLAIPLITAMVSFSICLYAIIEEEAYTLLTFLMSFFLIPSLYCVAGELLSSGFEEFSSQLYSCCWYNWNKANRRTSLIFLVFTQRELVIEIFPSLYARVRCILWTVKTLYSVLALLKSTRV
ncbi:Odorant receptor Or103, partial [Rhyzopertha dominica]